MDRSDILAHALTLWPGLEGARAVLINLSENHTFRIDPPAGPPFVLRVHRPHYHSRAAIESELAWMQALRAQAGLFTPRPCPGSNGDLVQEAEFGAAKDPRFMVLFQFETGSEPQPGDDLAPVFGQLGALAARCHLHVERWAPPIGFTRQAWTPETILAPAAIWGDWRASPLVEGPVRTMLDRLEARLRQRLAAYGRAPDRFGLIHADMRLANLLVEGGETRLLDFDDCGFGWFGYDLAAGLSFYEDQANVPELVAAWLEGYRRHRAFGAKHEAALAELVMLRRMALLAWIGSHGEVAFARALAPRFAPVTAELAERYFAGGLLAP